MPSVVGRNKRSALRQCSTDKRRNEFHLLRPTGWHFPDDLLNFPALQNIVGRSLMAASVGDSLNRRIRMKKSFLAIAITTLSITAVAEPFSYKYIELNYTNITQDLDASGYTYADLEADFLDRPTGKTGQVKQELEIEGYGATLSWDFDNVLLQVSRQNAEVSKVFGLDPSDYGYGNDATATGFFIGGHGEPDAKSSFFGGIGYTREKFQSVIGDFDTDVYSFGGGMRYWLFPMVELDASLAYVHARSKDLGASDNDGQYSIGLRFQPLKMVSIGAHYSSFVDASDTSSLTVDARYQF
jgi:hypothetical protein